MPTPERQLKVLIAGGGTGGHVIPALAIARELKSQHGAEVVFVGTSRGIENRLVPAAGFELRLIEVGQLNRVSIATRVKTLFKLPWSVVEASRMLNGVKPDVVLGVGGYASGPAMLAAILRGIPTMVFEPNLVPGMVNRRLASRTRIAAVHFAETGKWFPRFEVTGVPVRLEFFAIAPRKGGAPSLLVFGGSQGARAINNVVVESAAELKAKLPALRIVHQTGQAQFEPVSAAYRSAGIDAEVAPFIENMAERFAEADLVVCRSGASTVAEIAAAGKAAIFIPLPTAADDHQRRNAESLSSQDAAMLIPEPELTQARFVETVSSAFANPGRLVAIGENARKLAHRDAAAHVAKMAVSLVREGKSLSPSAV